MCYTMKSSTPPSINTDANLEETLEEKVRFYYREMGEE